VGKQAKHFVDGLMGFFFNGYAGSGWSIS